MTEPKGTQGRTSNDTLHALGIVQLHIVNLGIIPASRTIVDVEMALDLPVDIEHRTIGAMVCYQNCNVGRSILFYGSAGNAAPGGKKGGSALQEEKHVSRNG